ncbi:MAG: dihydrofolate reductase [Francisellaceae bacterium]
MLSIIVAYDQSRGIGLKKALPWKLADDLKNFKKITEAHYIVMGRKTFDSIGCPLPNRKNVILTRDKDYQQESCIIAHDVDDILHLEKNRPTQEIFIIGGAEIYTLFLPFVQRLYITHVNTQSQADAFFPSWDQANWQRIGHRHYQKDENNEHDFDFEVFERLTPIN